MRHALGKQPVFWRWIRLSARVQLRTLRDKEELSAANSRPLQFKQLPLAIDTPAIAGQVAAGGDHPMAGHDQRYSICGAGSGDRARGVGVTQFAGKLAVAAGFPAGYLTERLPDAKLKHGAAQIECP